MFKRKFDLILFGSAWIVIATIAMQSYSDTKLSNENMENIVGSCDCYIFGDCDDCVLPYEGADNYCECEHDVTVLNCYWGLGLEESHNCGTFSNPVDCGTYYDCSPAGCVSCEDYGSCSGYQTTTGGATNCGDIY